MGEALGFADGAADGLPVGELLGFPDGAAFGWADGLELTVGTSVTDETSDLHMPVHVTGHPSLTVLPLLAFSAYSTQYF